jgi:hypothetical protein
MSKPPPTLSLAEVARRLDCAGVTWAVFAGAAASVYGATRPLTDVDILVPAAEADWLTVLVPQATVIRREDGCMQGVQLPGIDILAGLSTMDLDTAMAERLTHHTISGVRVPVIPPEDNILLKAISGRGPEVGKHDWEDVEAMMDHLPALDWEYLRWRVDSCADPQQAGQALQRVLDQYSPPSA